MKYNEAEDKRQHVLALFAYMLTCTTIGSISPVLSNSESKNQEAGRNQTSGLRESRTSGTIKGVPQALSLRSSAKRESILG